MASSFFNSNNCSRSVLAKNWRLCTQMAASACKVSMRLNCTRVAASCMQIVPEWPPVACKFYLRGRQSHGAWIKLAEFCMRLAAMGVQFACDWRPLGYNLHASGGHSGTRKETSRQVVCRRPSLHHNYIFLALASPHPWSCFLLFSWRSIDVWFGKFAGTMDDKATQ
jgi:hypothetical protein